MLYVCTGPLTKKKQFGLPVVNVSRTQNLNLRIYFRLLYSSFGLFWNVSTAKYTASLNIILLPLILICRIGLFTKVSFVLFDDLEFMKLLYSVNEDLQQLSTYKRYKIFIKVYIEVYLTKAITTTIVKLLSWNYDHLDIWEILL